MLGRRARPQLDVEVLGAAVPDTDPLDGRIMRGAGEVTDTGRHVGPVADDVRGLPVVQVETVTHRGEILGAGDEARARFGPVTVTVVVTIRSTGWTGAGTAASTVAPPSAGQRRREV
jgi:hypothetical protein